MTPAAPTSTAKLAGPDDFDGIRSDYARLNTQGFHLNEWSNKYRMLASTWLFASFAGAGFLARSPDGPNPLPVHRLEALFYLMLAAASGIVLMWILDVFVYRRLLDATVAERRKLEVRYSWLPQVQLRIERMFANGMPIDRRISLYYLGCSVVLILIGSIGYLRHLLESPSLPKTCAFAVFTLASLISVTALWIKSPNPHFQEIDTALDSPLHTE